MTEIAVAKGVTVPEEGEPRFKSKMPSDVYKIALDLPQDLNEIVTADDGLDVPGGITVPPAKDGKISPVDVNRVLLRVLADVNAMKFASGIKTPTVKSAMEAGKTPGDVWRVLTYCRLIADALRSS